MNQPYSPYTDEQGSAPSPLPPKSEVKSTFSRIGVAISVFVVVMIAAQYGVSYLLVYLVPDVGSQWWPNWVVSVVPLYGIALPVLLLFLRRIPVAPHNRLLCTEFSSYDKPDFGFAEWLNLFFMGVGLMYIGSIVGQTLMTTLSEIVGYSYDNQLDAIVDASPLWATALVTCVVAPIGEEFIFRKLFIDRARRFGDTPAILLSGLIFGLFHGNFFQFFYAAMLGVVLAYIYTRTGNLWWCVGMHAAANLMGGIVVPKLAEQMPEDATAVLTGGQVAITAFLLVWMYGSMITAVVLLIKRFKFRALSPDSERRPAGKILREAMANPGMIVLSVLLLVMVAESLIPPELLQQLLS